VRLALVRIALLATSLLALALVVVPAVSAAGGGGETHRHLSIQMRVGAFRLEIDTQEHAGKQTAVLFISRRHQFAEYLVPAEVTDSTVKAKFGALGEIDYSYAPKGATNAECFGAEGSEAAFTGTFTFTGENDFIHIDADQATGFYGVEPEPPGCMPNRERRATAARAAPSSPKAGGSATLLASTSGKPTNGNRQARSFNVIGEGPSQRAGVIAVLAEDDHGMGVVRGVEMAIPGRAFEWDFAAGTATVAPPAPFTGTARLTKGADGRGRWTGSLRMPILGQRKPVSMAGPAFSAKLRQGSPSDP
jgi:hypothetical protein